MTNDIQNRIDDFYKKEIKRDAKIKKNTKGTKKTNK